MTPFMRLVLDVLEGRALSAYEIVRAIDREIPGALDGREGTVFPALLALERGGVVIPSWEMRPPGRRRVYRTSVRPADEPAPAGEPSSAEDSDGVA